MEDSAKDKASGTFHDLKGSVKEKVGYATNDPEMEAEGTDEKLSGKIQNKIGDIKKVFEK